MPKILLFGALMMFLTAANGQRLVLKGKVVDSISRKGLASATISLVRAADSALLTFGIADSAGAFRLITVGSGPFLLSVSYTGYQPVWRALADGENDLGEIVLTPYGLLREVQVEGPLLDAMRATNMMERFLKEYQIDTSELSTLATEQTVSETVTDTVRDTVSDTVSDK